MFLQKKPVALNMEMRKEYTLTGNIPFSGGTMKFL
jgi:hypothetical protein